MFLSDLEHSFNQNSFHINFKMNIEEQKSIFNVEYQKNKLKILCNQNTILDEDFSFPSFHGFDFQDNSFFADFNTISFEFKVVDEGIIFDVNENTEDSGENLLSCYLFEDEIFENLEEID